MRKFIVLAICAGCSSGPTNIPAAAPAVSSTIAMTSDDRALWVVNQDADSVSVIDPVKRTLVAEIALGSAPPSVDPTTQRFDPKVLPRALAIWQNQKVYVAGQSANQVFVLDAVKHTVLSKIAVAVSPVSVVAASDAIYVVSHEPALVTKIDPKTDQVVRTLPVPVHPWGASISADGKQLYVTHLLIGAGVTVIDTAEFAAASTLMLAEQMPDAGGRLVPNGLPRGAYSAVPRPGTGELWIPHLLLAVKTIQVEDPTQGLDFESTVFPTISTVTSEGKTEARRLLFKPAMVPGAKGSFIDSFSGPRALAFTPDGSLALLANSGSEDVLVFDGVSGNEKVLVRPLPVTMPEGIVVDHSGKHAYVDGRNSHTIAVLDIAETQSVPVTREDSAIERLNQDPMPTDLRLGQRLFYMANTSSPYPITKNFWVSCSSCHLEGGTDAVTWLFEQGPRDTPSNAGGPINTGFLMRQALRNDMIDYDITIRHEQGGAFDRTDPAQKTVLEALAKFVNYAIPIPQNPHVAADGTLTEAQTRGKITFNNLCASCHAGAFYTDSGAGNSSLDFTGPVLLHDVGTCVQSGSFNDQPAAAVDGTMHAACDFDTPTLRGIFASPPYFHDGSAATLRDVVDRLPFSAPLSEDDKNDLVEFLNTL